MPPSNTPAETPATGLPLPPATGLSLPPLLYYFPPTAPVVDASLSNSASSSGSANASSAQASSGSGGGENSTPAASSIATQPLLPVPPLFGILPAAGNESNERLSSPESRHRYGGRPNIGRDSDASHSNHNQPSNSQPYGPRIPSLLPGQRQTLYDWAPVLHFTGDDLNRRNRDREVEDFPPPSSFSMLSRIRDSSPPLPPGNASRSRIREISMPRFLGTLDFSADSSPFRTAFPQSLRRHPRHSHRSRSLWQGYAADAERSRERARERDREREREAEENLFEAARLAPSRIPISSRFENARTINASTRLPSSSYELEETIKYLAKLRSCMNIAESLKLALNSGFSRDAAWIHDGFNPKYDDFLLDTRSLKISETSWLSIGGTFWGSQATLEALPSEHTISASGNLSIISLGAMTPVTSTSPNKWIVKVNISGVDYKNMQLSGTMEAYADWQNYIPKTPEDGDGINETEPSSITTYLEGEIIDFKTHSLQTINFQSEIKDDAAYWRKLEPFSSLSNAQLVTSLTSKKFMNQLMEEYVLMRWKEKCFITSPNTSENTGLLTICGFYFLSLRRSDGHIQGFYYDPKCSPYQELKLKPQKRMFPSYEFR